VTADLPARYADRLTVQAEMFRVAETTGVSVDGFMTNSAGGVMAWLKPSAPASSSWASETDAREFLRVLGVVGPVAATSEGLSYGSYKADWSLNGTSWKVTVYATSPAEPGVPDVALMAAWRARGDNGCKDCVERPCPACAAHLTGIAAAVLKAGAR
jgi:hypothetical protein